jgi:Holliday junction resolvasome RuvABC endonuclease subunit
MSDEDGPDVVGIDLSLTGTGIAYANGSTVTINTAGLRGPERLVVIRDAVRAALDVAEWAPDLVMLEGYAYGRPNKAHELGELGGVVRVALHEECRGFPSMGWALVPPPRLKKFATGKGVADKTAMVVAARDRLGWAGMDNNQADALWLRAMGLALYGALPITLPQVNMSALCAVHFERRPKGLEP